MIVLRLQISKSEFCPISLFVFRCNKSVKIDKSIIRQASVPKICSLKNRGGKTPIINTPSFIHLDRWCKRLNQICKKNKNNTQTVVKINGLSILDMSDMCEIIDYIHGNVTTRLSEK